MRTENNCKVESSKSICYEQQTKARIKYLSGGLK